MENPSNQIKSPLDYALSYSNLNWSVIPIEPGEKKPLIKWEKYQKIRATEEQIKRWWKKYPNANIGIVTGLISDIIVIDVDSIAGKEIYVSTFGELHNTIAQRTGKPNAIQLIFKHPEGQPHQNMVGLLTDVDVRADGGYVVVPPSIHPNGTRYTWIIDPTEMGLDDLLNLPDDLRDKLMSSNPNKPKNEEGWVQEALMGVEEGKRNGTCTKLAGYFLRKFEGNIGQTKTALDEWNERNLPPLDWKEVIRTIESVARREGRDAMSDSVGEKIEKIQVMKYPEPDGTCRYRVFLVNYKGYTEMDTRDLITFSRFRVKFTELANKIPKPVKQLIWDRMVNKALAEAEIIEASIDETSAGLVLRMINSEVFSEGCMEEFKYLNNRVIVHDEEIYLKIEVLLNMIIAERGGEKISRKELGRCLRALGFENGLKKIQGTVVRCWYRKFNEEWKGMV